VQSIALLDVASLLAYLQIAEVRPLHGRWLSPRHFRALGRCLSPPLPCPDAGSERQVGRIAFAHYLAESLGLVTLAGQRLKPAPSALPWLETAPSVQVHALWRAWLAPTDENRERWRKYHLPGHKLRDPVGFARRLAEQASAADPSQLAFERASLEELLPWWERDDEAARLLVWEMLAGPLFWLGIVQRSAGFSPYTFTPLGAWLLGQPGAPPPDDEAQPLEPSPDLCFYLTDRPQLAGLLALAPWSDLEPGPCLRLTPRSIARAWERGGCLSELLSVVGRYTAPALSPAQRDTLRAWFDQIAGVTIQPYLLLRTTSSAEMDRLWRQPAIRSHLGHRLAPELATLETSTPAALVASLRRQGVAVRVALSPASPSQAMAGPLSHGEAEWLLVGFLIHGHLARRWGLTAAPPAALFDSLASALDPSRLAAAQATARQALARLESALDGPAPIPAALPERELIDRLESAIRSGRRLLLRYWSAARGEISERQIEPHCIEWRGDHAYLSAYCHLRREERTFRLDRIVGLEESA